MKGSYSICDLFDETKRLPHVCGPYGLTSVHGYVIGLIGLKVWADLNNVICNVVRSRGFLLRTFYVYSLSVLEPSYSL